MLGIISLCHATCFSSSLQCVITEKIKVVISHGCIEIEIRRIKFGFPFLFVRLGFLLAGGFIVSRMVIVGGIFRMDSVNLHVLSFAKGLAVSHPSSMYSKHSDIFL